MIGRGLRNSSRMARQRASVTVICDCHFARIAFLRCEQPFAHPFSPSSVLLHPALGFGARIECLVIFDVQTYRRNVPAEDVIVLATYIQLIGLLLSSHGWCDLRCTALHRSSPRIHTHDIYAESREGERGRERERRRYILRYTTDFYVTPLVSQIVVQEINSGDGTAGVMLSL